MKMKMPAAFLFMLSLLVASSASAQASVYSLSVPSTIEDPLSGFTINYSLGGSKWGVGAASAELRFYISASPNGSTGVALLYGTQIYLRGSGWGPYYAPSGNQSLVISRWNMPASTVTLLQNIAAACAPQTWYILAELDWSGYKYGQTLMGTTKQPDFYFTGGTMAPSVIQPGGSTNISFDVYTRCPASSWSTVGIFLADANHQLLSYIGGVSVASGAGTSSLPPSTITFSPYIPTGVYHIVLIADVDGMVAESDENNNAGAFRLDVTWNALTAADNERSTLELDAARPVDAHSALRGPALGAPDSYVQGFDSRAEP